MGVGAPPTSWPPLLCLDVGSKSPRSCSLRKSRSRRFHSVWTPFDIPFCRNPKTGKKQQFWARPPVNRLVPKIIKNYTLETYHASPSLIHARP